MKRSILGLTIVLGFLFIPTRVHSSAIFDKAVQLYRAGKYDSTITVVRFYLKKYGKNSESEKMVPLITEALVRKGEYASAYRLFSMFRQKFPQSAFIPRLYYVTGIALAKEEKYQQAITSFSSALEAGVSSVLDSLILSNTQKICQQLTANEFELLSTMPLNVRLLEIIKFYEIAGFSSMGQFVKAQNYAEDFRKLYPRSIFEPRLRNLVSLAQEKQRGVVQIGVLTPISGDEAEIGKNIVQGAQLAIDQFNKLNGFIAKTIVLDTRGNMVETVRRTRELVEDHKVPVIIGPVLSHTATVSAAMLMGKQTVMISPTATDDGIASLGRNIFQMNVTMGVLGRKVARYAAENLNINEYAILAPNSAYGKVLADNFKAEIQKRNLDLVYEDYYEEGANDFGSQLLNLRYKLLERHLEKMSIEKGLDFKGKVSRADSIKYLDSTLSVGGLFMPGDADDIVMLAPQVYFHRIRTQMLGSNGWHNPKVIQDGKRYISNAIISTSFELNQNQKSWLDFKAAYKTRYNAEPDRISALGYDAASLVMKSLALTGNDPSRINDALKKTLNYQGLSGLISFDGENGQNTEASILKVTETGFLRVQ
ncbi:MAG TPA: ABC transporter substrate-binding protein [Chitinispirillaceae bacterium]|nr:ABC transporter substrate-binding protein [Chitinispirillaceae bacterium]